MIKEDILWKDLSPYQQMVIKTAVKLFIVEQQQLEEFTCGTPDWY